LNCPSTLRSASPTSRRCGRRWKRRRFRALVVVAWEHRIIDVVARDLLKSHGGDPELVPTWPDDDFDGVDIVTIGADGRATFQRSAEGLDGQPEACPG